MKKRPLFSLFNSWWGFPVYLPWHKYWADVYHSRQWHALHTALHQSCTVPSPTIHPTKQQQNIHARNTFWTCYQLWFVFQMKNIYKSFLLSNSFDTALSMLWEICSGVLCFNLLKLATTANHMMKESKWFYSCNSQCYWDWDITLTEKFRIQI